MLVSVTAPPAWGQMIVTTTPASRDSQRQAAVKRNRRPMMLRSQAAGGTYEKQDGAVEKTRTSTGCPTATSTLRVYQFRHDRTKSRFV
jgi:hypothetical protein